MQRDSLRRVFVLSLVLLTVVIVVAAQDSTFTDSAPSAGLANDCLPQPAGSRSDDACSAGNDADAALDVFAPEATVSVTPKLFTDTPVPPTSTAAPGTSTAAPGTSTAAPGTSTPAPGTDTPAPGTDTPVPETSTPVPPTHTHTATLTATLLPPGLVELLANGGFEVDADANKQPDGWTVANKSRDRLKCNSETTLFSFRGACAYRFQGRPNEDARLNQFPVISGVTLEGGEHFSASVQYRTNAVNPRLRLKLKVFYLGDALPVGKAKFTINTQAAAYTLVTLPDYAVVGAVERVKFQFQNHATSGKVYVDDASLIYDPNE